MPRAYSPNLATVRRASLACNALGITGWHMAAGPDVVYWADVAGPSRRLVRVPLRTLEARLATRKFRPFCYMLKCPNAALPDSLGCEHHPHAEDAPIG